MAITAQQLADLAASRGTARGAGGARSALGPTPASARGVGSPSALPSRTPGAFSRGGAIDPITGQPTINPALSFQHPVYAGSDPAYAAWLAQADLQSNDAVSQAKLRRAQANDAYTQALADLNTNATTGRRNLQTNVLERGMFHSGEYDRRQQEMDSAVDQAKKKAYGALTNQIGTIDETQTNAINNLGMQGVTQLSQAMMRDSLAAYNAQQAAAAQASAPPQAQAAPQAFAPQPQATAPTYNPKPPASPTYNPVTSSAGLYQAQSKPKPKAASGSTGALVQKRTGLQ